MKNNLPKRIRYKGQIYEAVRVDKPHPNYYSAGAASRIYNDTAKLFRSEAVNYINEDFKDIIFDNLVDINNVEQFEFDTDFGQRSFIINLSWTYKDPEIVNITNAQRNQCRRQLMGLCNNFIDKIQHDERFNSDLGPIDIKGRVQIYQDGDSYEAGFGKKGWASISFHGDDIANMQSKLFKSYDKFYKGMDKFKFDYKTGEVINKNTEQIVAKTHPVKWGDVRYGNEDGVKVYGFDFDYLDPDLSREDIEIIRDKIDSGYVFKKDR